MAKIFQVSSSGNFQNGGAAKNFFPKNEIYLFSLFDFFQVGNMNFSVYLSYRPYFNFSTEARWHIGMSSASHRDDPGSNPGKG